MIDYLIVDDEPLAHDLLEDYCSLLPHLRLKKHCYNAMEAIDFFSKDTVDLMFLDLNMPKLTGFDFLKTLRQPPQVIVTTAYSEHALQGFELDVVDYLLKPFGFDRLVQAVNKATIRTAPNATGSGETVEQRFFIKGDKTYHQVNTADIRYIEAFGNYTKMFFADDFLLCHESISAYADILPKDQFMRVHKSFVVAVAKIDRIQGNVLVLGESKVPVGQTYRREVSALYQ
ncbi:LytR/AlgR family response regulator transcription factor [Neolewinella persica]|uniref:LytR/AlgR family response regulator transcription factor n=1 Tax=Neolewinella persica TaxID=70998 RepID=UPI000371CE92|nr:LytTR family DNA-binding domain-containing protein [Neolewinella persica]